MLLSLTDAGFEPMIAAVTASPHEVELLAAPASEVSEPLYFPAAAPRLFGWLHRPAAGSGATGVVVCKPFGYELLVGHRSLRAFAETAAAAGIPALRFDYQGTGDAAEIDPEADQIEAWCRDVEAAVDELRARTGVTRICLLGFRLGALIATLAAARCDSVTGLVLIAPVTSGRGYLRELRRQQLAARVDPGADDPDGAAAGEARGAMDVAGHAMSGATVGALSGLELADRTAPGRASILIIDRDDLPAAQTWYRSLRAAGTDAEYRALPGFVGMMMTTPFLTSLPDAMLEATREWLVRFAARPGADVSAVHAPETARELKLPDPDSGDAITERTVRFGPGAILFGIVSEPRRGEERRRGVVLLNNGADYHIGASRMYVSLARHWARSGYAVLRMDLDGLGDSGVRPGGPVNKVYPPAAIEDVRAAVDFMREQYGASDLTVGGLCSGAYHALGAAVAGLPLSRILMINPEAFSWKEDAPPSAQNVTAGGALSARALSVAHWKKLLSGQVSPARGLTVLSRRLALTLGAYLSALSRTLRINLPSDAAQQFEQIARRGVQITIVFARGEPGIELLQLQAGSAVRRLGERCRVHVIGGGNHTFTQSSSRMVLQWFLSDELFRRAPGPSREPDG
jgi:alpha-beta hydrolase superfamily lysophospholipase